MQAQERLIGVLAALGAFGIWGIVPMFFKLLAQLDPGVVIAHRILWTCLLIAVWQLIRHRSRVIAALRLRPMVLLALLGSAIAVSVNWVTFVWAVSNDQVLSTSLGYFINPLVSVVLGMVFLGERLNRAGLVAVLLATCSTLYLGWAIGEPPWVALILAFSFGLYGLIRKMAPAGPLTGLWWETVWLMVPALFYLRLADGIRFDPFAPYDLGTSLLLIGAGIVTLVPLALFALAARCLPLSTVGFFQYLAPSISFMLAVFLYDEPFGREQAVAFGGIWIALAIFASSARRRRPPVSDSARTPRE